MYFKKKNIISYEFVERDVVHKDLMAFLRLDLKASLIALLKHIGSVEEPSKDDVIYEKVFIFIIDESLEDINGEEFRMFLDFLNGSSIFGEKSPDERVVELSRIIEGQYDLDGQLNMILYDTPGVIEKKMQKLDSMMMKNVRSAAINVDCVIVVVDATKAPQKIDEVLEGVGELKDKLLIVLVLNKKDLIKPGEIAKELRWHKLLQVENLDPLVLWAIAAISFISYIRVYKATRDPKFAGFVSKISELMLMVEVGMRSRFESWNNVEGLEEEI